MTPPPWAYQVDFFSPPPDDELICSVCQAVFCDPVQSPCNHVFCRNCIVKWLENNRNCPICRKRTTRSTLQEVVPLVKNMIMKLNLRCHNSERGCEEKFSLEGCEAHIKECPFELVQCKNKPCKLIFMKRDIPNHESNTCAYSYVRCSTCTLKTSPRNPDAHKCIEDLLKKLRNKTQQLRKETLKNKKLKEEIKKLKAISSTDSSSSESLSPADVLFSFEDNSNSSIASSFSSSLASDSADEDDTVWTFPVSPRLEDSFETDRMNNHYEQSHDSSNQQDYSIEFPRSVSPANLDDSSVLVVEPAEPVIDDDDDTYIRRPHKRTISARIFDSTDEEDGDLDSSSQHSRKRTWQFFHENSHGTEAASNSNMPNVAGPSYLSSNTESSTSTNDSSPSNRRYNFKLRPRLRSRSQDQQLPTVSSSSVVAPQNASPIFERTISLLEQYNLESDPEWLPPSNNGRTLYDIFDVEHGAHTTTSSDESSSNSDLESESSYEDAAEGRTEDLLNSFYGSSDSEDEWRP